MSGECDLCGEHVIECICDQFKRYTTKRGYFPIPGETVLCVKKYFDEQGWTEPKYVLDNGFRNAYGEFCWRKGGQVSEWMRLPQIKEEI